MRFICQLGSNRRVVPSGRFRMVPGGVHCQAPLCHITGYSIRWAAAEWVWCTERKTLRWAAR